MKKIFFLFIVGLCLHYTSYAQVVISDLKVNKAELNTYAALKIVSERSGVLLPKLSKIRIDEKEKNHTGELFFSKEHNCLMINTAMPEATTPKWKCIANEPEAIPKN